MSQSLIVEATLSAAGAHPLAKLEGQSPLNLNIRSLWFEALGCSAPIADLKADTALVSSAPIAKITHHGKKKTCFCCVSLDLNALRLLHRSRISTAKKKKGEQKKKEMMGKRKRKGWERGRGKKGGGRWRWRKEKEERGGEKSQKPPHNNAREKSEHFPPKDGPFPNPCALSDKLK